MALRGTSEPHIGSSDENTAENPGALLSLSEKNLSHNLLPEENMSPGAVSPQNIPDDNALSTFLDKIASLDLGYESQ